MRIWGKGGGGVKVALLYKEFGSAMAALRHLRKLALSDLLSDMRPGVILSLQSAFK